jgi:hypothetical protein
MEIVGPEVSDRATAFADGVEIREPPTASNSVAITDVVLERSDFGFMNPIKANDRTMSGLTFG